MAQRTLKIVSLKVFLCLCFITLTTQQCLTPNDARRSTNKLTYSSLYQGQQNFSLDLLAEINKRVSSKENIFFSPYSVYHALLLAYFITTNHTERSLHNALRFSENMDKLDIFNAYKFNQKLGPPYEFNSANKIFAAKDLNVRDCIEQLFLDEIEPLDFRTDPLAAVNHINNWVESQTRGMISNLLPADAVDQLTTIVLANAAFFKGEWESRFQAEETHQALFYTSRNETHYVDMMTQEGTFDYESSESLGAVILRMPYKGEQASMFILLPPWSTKNGLEKVLANLNANTIRDIVMPNSMLPRTVNVTLPKFSVEKTLELAPILEGLGVGDLLHQTADFSVLLDNPKQKVTLGGAIHKARIEVNEEGTEAAAATAIFTFRSSRPAEPAQFNANHPFVYFIYDSKKKAILFSGVFRRPKNLANTVA